MQFHGGVVGKLIALQTVGRGEVAAGSLHGIEAGQAVVGTEPELAAVIFQDAEDGVVRQSVCFREAGKVARAHIKKQQAARVGPQPVVALFVFMNSAYGVADVIDRMLFTVAVDLYEGGIVAAPEIAFTVFCQALYVGDGFIEYLEAVGSTVNGVQCTVVGSTGPERFLSVFIQYP